MKEKKGNLGFERGQEGQEIDVTGSLPLPDALPGWELDLILPALAKLLTPAARAPNAEEADDARQG